MRSKILLISNLLSTVYAVYLITYFFGNTASAGDTAEAVGSALATALVMPHMLMFLFGALFGWIGYFAKKSWGALTGAILYSVGTLFFLVYAMFGIPLLILGFVGYAKQKKCNAKSAAVNNTTSVEA